MIVSCLFRRVEVFRGYRLRVELNVNLQSFALEPVLEQSEQESMA